MTVKLKNRFLDAESKYARVSPAILARQQREENAMQAHADQMDKAVTEAARIGDLEENKQTRLQESMRKSRIPKNLDRIYEQTLDAIFKDLLFEAYRGSLVHDEEDIVAAEESLRQLVYEHVDKIGGYTHLKNSIKQNPNVAILKEMAMLCEAVAKENVKSKRKKMEEDCVEPAEIGFELEDDLKQRYDYEKKEVGLDQVADLVKKNVLTVVLDEKTRQTKQKEMDEALAQEIAAKATDEKSVEESYRNAHVGGGRKIEEATIFNSITRSTALMVLKEAASIQRTKKEREDDEEEYEENSNGGEDVIKKITQVANTTAEVGPSYQSSKDDVEMDLILAEATAQYTLIELMDTLCLEHYNHARLKEMSQNLLNTK